MFCKYCGKEIPDTAKYCDGCGCPTEDKPRTSRVSESKKAPKKKKKRHPILGTIILIFGIFIFIGALVGESDEPKKVDNNSASVAEVATTTTPPIFTVGDTLEMGNVLVTLVDVSESAGTQLMAPTAGNVFVTCEFTIENNTNSEMAVSSMMSFECYFDNYAANLSIGGMVSDQSKQQLDGSVAPGKKINGVVCYEAPEDWAEMEIHFKSNIYSSKPFIFNYSK